jgi:aspartate/methionine/tyrosine aminotransferase
MRDDAGVAWTASRIESAWKFVRIAQRKKGPSMNPESLRALHDALRRTTSPQTAMRTRDAVAAPKAPKMTTQSRPQPPMPPAPTAPIDLRAPTSSARVPDFEALRKRAFNLRWAECAPDVIPLTAADPDLPVSSVVTQAIARYVSTPHLPYGPPAGLAEYRQALAAHFARTKSADIDPSRVIATNSAASAIVLVAREVLKAGDEVVVQDPVDFLVAESVRRAGATLRFWKPTDGRFTLDGLKEALTSKTRALFVCHPHNPLGTLWTPAEVRAIAAEASERGIAIVSDEVWSDVVLDGRAFRSFAAYGEDECRAWVIHGMSKGFALAGLRIGAVIAPDRKAADSFIQTQGFAQTIEGAATLSQIAAIAALRDTTAWRTAFLEHCGRMRDHAMRRLSRLKGISVEHAPEATFVLFANIAETGIAEEELARRIEHIARVRVVPGSPRWFGASAAGHLRFSLATTREVLDEAIDRISQEWKTILKGA